MGPINDQLDKQNPMACTTYQPKNHLLMDPQMKAIWMRNHLICMRIYDQRKAIIQCITHHIWMALKHQMGPINEHLMTTSMV